MRAKDGYGSHAAVALFGMDIMTCFCTVLCSATFRLHGFLESDAGCSIFQPFILLPEKLHSRKFKSTSSFKNADNKNTVM